MQPSRGNLLVRPVETAETIGDGRITLLEETRERWTGMQCEVVAVGDPEICDDEMCERLHWTDSHMTIHRAEAHVGDWLLVRPRCYTATDEENLWVIKQSDVLARLLAD